MGGVTLSVRPFRMGSDKEAALKPLEEAAEAFGAWQALAHGAVLHSFAHQARIEEGRRTALADELADTITACCNLAARYDLDMQAALDRVERHNFERGRYA